MRPIVAIVLFIGAVGPFICEAEAARTGEFQLTFTMSELTGAESARAMAHVVSPDQPITWEVYVPDGYRPEVPAGLIVYVSPSASGRIPGRWKAVLDRHNLIWIAASGSGNRVRSLHRATFALVAPTVAQRFYTVDAERIYVSGFSGGGKVAGMLAAGYPRLFRGALYICGIDSLKKNPPKEPERFRENPYVFLSGSDDPALRETKEVHRQYLEAGARHSSLMVIRNMGHSNPEESDFEAAIRYLDTRHVNGSKCIGCVEPG